ncbi:dynein regulatory complex subunit 2 isoform X1 [Monomorium pharaonis]|uniref:dynein regulatory complex subunit 2 isoform X1 n=1 Tax=Monomorium pharaonis TaxID=307658 RepID=UPI00174794EE|nr:dynein regulatory complex subunit 2 isoform X1 [Monomorium pharaonis]
MTKDKKEYEAQEHAKMLRKKHLMREIKLGALNTNRYRTLWREMMMRIKMPQIIENVEIAWRNFDRALDIKDYRISFLMDELSEAEEQYQRNTRSHMEIIDRLLRSYKERIESKEKNYRRTLNDTLVQTNDEISKIYYQKNQFEISLQSITKGIQQQLEESLNNVKSIALKTKSRRKCYEALKDKDEKDQKVIAQQLLRTANHFEEIRKFRDNIATYEATTKKEISEIATEYDFFQKASWTVKNRLLSGVHYSDFCFNLYWQFVKLDSLISNNMKKFLCNNILLLQFILYSIHVKVFYTETSH